MKWLDCSKPLEEVADRDLCRTSSWRNHNDPTRYKLYFYYDGKCFFSVKLDRKKTLLTWKCTYNSHSIVIVELLSPNCQLAIRLCQSYLPCVHVGHSEAVQPPHPLFSWGRQAKPRWPHTPELSAVFAHWRSWYLTSAAMFTNSPVGVWLYTSESCLPDFPPLPSLPVHPFAMKWELMQLLDLDQPAGPTINASFKDQWSKAVAQTTFI